MNKIELRVVMHDLERAPHCCFCFSTRRMPVDVDATQHSTEGPRHVSAGATERTDDRCQRMEADYHRYSCLL